MSIYETWHEIAQNEVNGLTGARLLLKLFRSSAQILYIILPVIPLDLFQISAAVTEILAFAYRVK